jgi:hypothetical protein
MEKLYCLIWHESPPGTGGVAAAKNIAEGILRLTQPGWSLTDKINMDLNGPPRLCITKDAFGAIFVVAQPPLLSQEGTD